MALFNLLLFPILAALGLFTPDGDGGSGGSSGDGAGGGGAANGGAAGGTDGGNAGGTGQGGATGSGSATGDGDDKKKPAAGGQEPPKPQAGTQLVDVEALQRELNEARSEAGRYRAAGIQAIAQALGIELPKQKGEEGQEAAITQLQSEINSLRSEARSNAIEAAFERTVSTLGAKPVLTRRYVADQLKDLDPKGEGFADKMRQIVQAAIDEEPALKAAQAAPRSGGEFNGDGGGDNDLESMSIDELRKKRTEARGAAV